MNTDETKKSLLVSIVVISISLLFYLVLIPNYVQGGSINGVSPQFFPKLGVVLIAISGVILFFSTLKRFFAPVNKNLPADKGSRSSFNFKPVYVFIVLMAFNLLFEFAGYFIAAPFLIITLMIVFGLRKPVAILCVSGIVSLVLYAVFKYALNLPLV